MASAFRGRKPDTSSDESDSYSDDETSWKRKCTAPNKAVETFINPLAGKKPPKFKNNVWSTVLTDQAVSGDLGNFNLVEDEDEDVKVDRGPESFRVTADAVKKLYGNEPIKYEDNESESGSESAESGEDNEVENVTKKEKKKQSKKSKKPKNFIDWDHTDDMETNEAVESDEEKAPKDDFLAQLEKYKKAKEAFEKRPKPRDLREKITGNKRKNDLREKVHKNRQDRLERDNVGRSYVFTSGARFQSDVPKPDLATASKDEVLNCIMKSLQEQNKELFSRIVENIDAEKLLNTLSKTEDIENAGGMMINSGMRRRTPGGVFIQLLKSDPIMTPELTEEIFPSQDLQQIKEQRKQKRKQRKKEVKALRQEERKRRQELTNTMDDEGCGIVTVEAPDQAIGSMEMEPVEVGKTIMEI